MWQACFCPRLKCWLMTCWGLLPLTARDAPVPAGGRWSPPDPSIANIHYVHCTLYTTLPTRRPGMTTGAVENVNKSCGQESREQWTLHLVVTLDLSTLYSVLTTYNLVELSEAGTCLYALGLKIQVIEFLGGQY